MHLMPHETLPGGVVARLADGASFDAWLDALTDPEQARTFAASLARLVPYAAIAWELPPLTTASLSEPFACAVLDHPALARVTADRRPFADHLRGDVAVFENLGRDALLVAPVPRGPDRNYAHLMVFLRRAGPDEHAVLFGALARAIRGRLSRERLWVSTAGMGVSWLHLRLDRRPKYYRYRPYRDRYS